MKKNTEKYGTLQQSKVMVGLESLALLFLRLVLAYGFYEPAKSKISDVPAIAEWFASMHYIAPVFSAYVATYTEVVGVLLLLLGLGTRWISIPLMFMMLVAIKSVHWVHGFNASNNGFEIPLYYFLMLFFLFTQGAGKISLDYLLSKKISNNNDPSFNKT